MRILGIETSCDESAAAVVEDGNLISSIVLSQTDHSEFGGVVPEIASRAHIRAIVPVVESCLKRSGAGLEAVDAVAVTLGPGLIGSLIVGIAFAKGICFSWDKPLVGVDHIESHIAAVGLDHPGLDQPMVCLVVSGGHTHLFRVEPGRAETEQGEQTGAGTGRSDAVAGGAGQGPALELLGATRDDAAGEAFDKVARMLGLPYPGGPEVEREARSGDPAAIDFPRPVKLKDYEFSFSGLKTAVRYFIERNQGEISPGLRADIAASFQEAATDVLTDKTIAAAKQTGVKYVSAVGGVASNSYLREKLARAAAAEGLTMLLPSPELCTDNAAIVAMSGLMQFRAGRISGLDASPYSTRSYGEPETP
ncbi:MAG: tRNA (adenosine(37)-N6)-threonylcarbamoyltransferase complex transferase subunit TsaD [bacterium]|jgi:N6-L-threonylcarbamoyladenine synthase